MEAKGKDLLKWDLMGRDREALDSEWPRGLGTREEEALGQSLFLLFLLLSQCQIVLSFPVTQIP